MNSSTQNKTRAKRLLPDPSLPFNKQREITLLALCIYGEARGESNEGKQAVAHVILNRWRKQSWYGKTIASVILKAKQFSCFNSKDPNSKKLRAMRNSKAWRSCLEAALQVYLGETIDPTRGATHYHTKAIHPRWAKQFIQTAVIENHIFYA